MWSCYVPLLRLTHIQESALERVFLKPQVCQSHAYRYVDQLLNNNFLADKLGVNIANRVCRGGSVGWRCSGYASLSAQTNEVHSSKVKSLSVPYHTEAVSCAADTDTTITPPFHLNTTQAFLLFDSEDKRSTGAESCH